MMKIVVTDELACKLTRLPKRIDLCDDQGNTIRVFERIGESSDIQIAAMSEDEILQTLHEIF
jgi:hypothetical protein